MKLPSTSLIAISCSILSVLLLPSVIRAQDATPAPPARGPIVRLFDGKTLDGWTVTEFGGEGQVKVEDGNLVLSYGEALTGVTWTGSKNHPKLKLPRDNYELRLEAMRVDGSDFFCGLTFPVGPDPCSFILGGWGGGVVGLSSIDGYDASENETTQFSEIKEKKWYKVRVRVSTKAIQVWLDEKPIIDVPRENRQFSIRVEVELSKPLGLASWQTTAALRNIVLQTLEPEQPPDSADAHSNGGKDRGCQPAPSCCRKRAHRRCRRRRCR